MKTTRKLARIAATGMVTFGIVSAMGAVATTAGAAAADRAGVWAVEGHSFTIRAAASTSSAKLATIGDSGAKVACTHTPCVRNNSGGSYTCWHGGPSDNDWLKVVWGNRSGWVAAACVEGGRI
ncbi:MULTISPECIES: hypothetical protein [Streptomyces]|uniref:hypothetical protein n=1 Tax=Streptomyces TaxID=1883 RepID=UPI0011E4D166|nr:hypothetical protein [Streptomyces sp. MOE7]